MRERAEELFKAALPFRESTPQPSSHLSLFNFMEEEVTEDVNLKFLTEPRTSDVSVLERVPDIKRIFIMLNSVLPASAAVERLFSVGGLVFVPNRARLSDRNFENLVLNKYNAHLFEH